MDDAKLKEKAMMAVVAVVPPDSGQRRKRLEARGEGVRQGVRPVRAGGETDRREAQVE